MEDTNIQPLGSQIPTLPLATSVPQQINTEQQAVTIQLEEPKPKLKLKIISSIILVVFIILTLVSFFGLVPPLLALIFMPATPGEKYGPLGISNPPLYMLISWGIFCLFLVFVTLKLIKKRIIGFYLAIAVAVFWLLSSLVVGSIVSVLLSLLIIIGLIAAKRNYS